MSYFNPKIYNKQNLKEDDLSELSYWETVFRNLIENTQMQERVSTGSQTMDNIKDEIIAGFCEELKVALGYELQQNAVAIIDNYGEDVPEREDFETFLVEDYENE